MPNYITKKWPFPPYTIYCVGNKSIDKIAEKFKNEEASVQDFLNHLEGNKLLSVNDRVSKIMADAILLSGTKFNEQAARDCFIS